MSVRLEWFQYLPRGIAGWGSRRLVFGSMFTAVQAPNGAGKTPIMKGIMQGLGHEVELPPEVIQHCEFAQLGVSLDGKPATLTRRLGDEFEIEVEDSSGRTLFTSQADYAQWFVGLFAENRPKLTSKQGIQSELYATVLFPAFWVDQDHGWTTDYWTPPHRNFIRDQRQEVIRFLTGLPPRHPFSSRKGYDAARKYLERTEHALELQRFVVDRLRSNEHISDGEDLYLSERRVTLAQELEANSDAVEAIRGSSASFNREIEELQARRQTLVAQRAELLNTKSQLSLVLSELDGEEEILTANVQATDLLRQFCSRSGCQMFKTSEGSFGRSLLFLKDQIKDLKSTTSDLSRRLSSTEERIQRLDLDIEITREQRRQALASSPVVEAMTKISVLTKDLVETELRLAKVEQYKSELAKLERLIDQREQATVAVSELRPTGGRGRNNTSDVRQMLSDSIQQWLTALGTRNTRSAYFDDDFTLHIDGTKFSATTHQSGSTRTRIVLAFHAALLEVALARGGNHPGWLLFDAPKQHELSQADFDAYAERLKSLADKFPGRVQVVFSAADLKTQFEPGDEVWHARFSSTDGARFLGPA